MAKLWYLLCFLLFNIIYTINEDINSFSNINSTNNIRFLKSSPKKKKNISSIIKQLEFY